LLKKSKNFFKKKKRSTPFLPTFPNF